ncbi:hypothetical protein K8O93_01100 [Gordonia bronchialis]|uniref:hypothetical protein n=1 Tax=Gordonia bronchialis TaxID=2054 RepID=UPI001CBA6EAD|nr:hypothetical protein [Gordonia bronchialis]UAK38431.1 hypothetical protein K8O93_01100 [Gordonia bronchialis]
MRCETQRFEHSETQSGDCWRTALACLLDLPRDEVPHVIDHEDWWERSRAFVAEHTDMQLLNVEPVFPIYLDPENAPQHVIGVGKSPRGDFNHCVVVDAISGELAWDPHPSRAGLNGPILEVSLIGVLGEAE